MPSKPLPKFDEGVASRFWSKVAKLPRNSCWEWQASRRKDGYGNFGIRHEGVFYAHRVAWSLSTQKNPGTLSVLHKCDNRRCVRPSHLYLGTRQQNSRDSLLRDRRILKLRTIDIPKIRSLLASGLDQQAIATRFNITQSTVSRIKTGAYWSAVQ